MSQLFQQDGKVIPVTLIGAGPCDVLVVRTKERDGYQAVQLGLPAEHQRKDAKRKKFSYVREFDLGSEIKTGATVDVSSFAEGDKVKVSGVTKGKGFQGGVKRWGFSGRNATHGVKHEQRTIGSVGSRFPQRVIKGRKMPGRAGGLRRSVQNAVIVQINADQNVLAIKGAIPGRRGTLLEIRGI